MQIRDLVGKTREQIAKVGDVDGYPVQEVVKFSSGYYVRMGRGDMLQVKGHYTLKDVHLPREARSSDVIQSYGEFGSSIGVPFRG